MAGPSLQSRTTLPCRIEHFVVSGYTFCMTSLELFELVAKQRAFFSTGQTHDLAFRKRQLASLKNTLLKYQDKILEALAQDLSKSPVEAYATELGVILKEIDFMRRRLGFWARPQLRLTPPALLPGTSKVISEPYGCVLVISPWNYPFQLPLMAAVAAIAAGNCVIIKPSNSTPACEQLLVAIIAECFPQEYVAVVTGGTEIHHPLLTQKYNFIFYTGGATAGKKVMEAAARNLTPVCLELGGKSPCIVDGTADIGVAAKRIIWGKLVNSGQSCIAPDYVLVQEERKDELIEKMRVAIGEFYGEDPVSPESSLASIVNERHFFRLLNLANGNNPANGRVVTSSPDSLIYNKEARKIKPVILDSPEPDAPVMQDEIFGPVLPVLPIRSVEEAISFVQQRPEPLALYLFSQDRAAQRLVAQSLRYGGGCINDTMLHAASPHLPFGGTGFSGMGSYHGKAGFDTFSHRKSILTKPAKLDIALRYPPYGDRVMGLLKMLFK